MNNGNHEQKVNERALRNKVARAVFAAAESEGISDRETIEHLTNQVIDHLELVPTLPGLEHLIPTQRRPIQAAEIQSMVRSIILKIKREETEQKTDSDEKKITKTPPKLNILEVQAAKNKAIISNNARAVLERRYLVRDEKGRVIETPEDMFRRVAHHIAKAELNYNPKADITALEEEFYQAMLNMEFLPNSPTLMNAGRELGQLSACFVLPIEDSMSSIFDTLKYTALIHKSGGGTGFSFSSLRPEGDLVGSTGGVASGPVSFMKAFDAATDVIKQGGKRRGANMAILNVDHPDILKFIKAKEDNTSLTNFNISVAITEDFMKAVENGSDYELVNPRISKAVDRKTVEKKNAKDVFDKMVEMAWKNGDPGIIFIDRINDRNPTPKLGSIVSTNPCGEQPLLPYESCNLGSINLSKMLTTKNGAAIIDYVKLEKTVKMAVRFLDNVIDVNKFPLSEIEKITKKTRKIGLGVMGFADMLIKLNIPYDSKSALDKAEEIMRFIQEKSADASQELAKERGTFPAFEGSIYDVPGGSKVRNATRTTIAPTGTLSIIAGCSSGIEPLFALSYTRTILEGEQFIEINPLFEHAAKTEGFYSETLMQEVAQKGSLKDIDGVPNKIKRIFVVAHQIAPEWHVRMQAAFQSQTHNAVSKTVNFPHNATKEDVASVYMQAYRDGCKGITIYRDRSRESQVLSISKAKPDDKAKSVEEARLVPMERPTITRGFTEKVATGCGNLYVTVNTDDRGALYELFCTLGKTGGCASAQLEAIGRLISTALRSGVDIESVIKQLKGIRCPSIAWDKGHATLSCADAIAGVLERHKNNSLGVDEAKSKATTKDNPKSSMVSAIRNLAGQCPECASLLVYQEGCLICPACGYTKC